jgi:hypothetical protein
MNNRIIALSVLSLSALLAPAQKVGAAVAYTNSLTNVELVSSNFTSYTTVDSDYINNPSGGWFVVDTNYGLELLSTNPNYVEGLATYNRLLQASNDWTITIQSHISAFTNSQTNPYYSAGISLIQTTTNGLIYPNRIDLNLVRTGVSGATLSNSIISSLYINNGETGTAANKNLTNVYLRFRYTASYNTLVSAYSTNGSNFTTIQSYNLVTGWKIKSTDQLTLGVAANNQPDGRVIPNYNVLPGTIYLRNLTVVSTNASTNAPPNNTTGGTLGGTLSLGTGNSQNSYSGGLTLSNGGLVFSGGTTIGGSSTLSIGSGTSSNGSNSNSNTNILSGGTSTGSGTLNFTNNGGTPPNTGTSTNTIPGGIAGGGLNMTNPAVLSFTSLSNIPTSLYSSNGTVVNVIGVGLYTNVNGVFIH